MLIEERVTEAIIGAAIDVHRCLGPGLLESAYEECLCHELHLHNLSFQRQVELSVEYKNIKLDCGYRLDLVVENAVVVELKSNRTNPSHSSGSTADLPAPGRKKGRIADQFHVSALKNGIVRRVL